MNNLNSPPEFFTSPNPNIDDILGEYKKPGKQINQPFNKDISAGKNTYIYDAHTYHTKVPPEGIKELIEYYTEPGDVVLDPFCGSGMTGFAATSIGRKAILSDISPAAAFIAYNLNTPIDSYIYSQKIKQILSEAKELEKTLYTTICRECGIETLMLYSEMNFLWESWLQTYTEKSEEAIVNKVQNKNEHDYRKLLTAAFSEVYRVLKDGAWFTVMFHNSSAAIWKSLQLAIADAGFEIKASQTFDKKHGTFKQFVAENAVGYDLVLHCKKSPVPKKPTKKFPDIKTITQFIKTELSNGDNYKIEYLHVNRNSEFDYRKLYSKWLSNFISKEVISLDFDKFKKITDKVLKDFKEDHKVETA